MNDANTVVRVLVLLGQVLELRARERTGGALRALLVARIVPRFSTNRLLAINAAQNAAGVRHGKRE